jgi:hypothetical protein
MRLQLSKSVLKPTLNSNGQEQPNADHLNNSQRSICAFFYQRRRNRHSKNSSLMTAFTR